MSGAPRGSAQDTLCHARWQVIQEPTELAAGWPGGGGSLTDLKPGLTFSQRIFENIVRRKEKYRLHSNTCVRHHQSTYMCKVSTHLPYFLSAYPRNRFFGNMLWRPFHYINYLFFVTCFTKTESCIFGKEEQYFLPLRTFSSQGPCPFKHYFLHSGLYPLRSPFPPQGPCPKRKSLSICRQGTLFLLKGPNREEP
jgi:hypothetical protein